MIAFALLVGPFALSFHMHYPDEMYYTDAAVKMLQNGDYLTTYLGSGELRFKKPIGTYWTVLAGFKLFGVNPFASRFFFLIAGAMTVGFTYRAAKILFEDARIAGLSALIMASNPVLIFSATRSIPDVLLAMTMTASAVGFAGLIRYGNAAPKKYLWILYISLALAFEVKGLPAAALGGIGLIYLLFNPWEKISFKTLFHFPSILVSIFIALFWFVAMWKIHGPTYLDSFLEDQVGTRVASRYILISQNGFLAMGILVLIFLPWVIFALAKAKSSIIRARKENPVFFWFAILWGLAILGMGAMTSRFYERYLLPVAPVLAILLAWLLVRAEFESKRTALKITSWFFLVLNSVIFFFSLWLNINLGAPLLVYAQLGLALLILLYLGQATIKNKKLPNVIAYGFMLLFFLLSTGTFQISLPDQGQQLKAFAAQEKIDPAGKIGFIGNLHTSSKIRIGLGTDFHMIDLDHHELENEIKNYDRLIIEDKYLDSIDTVGFHMEVASLNWASRAIPDLLKNAGNPDFKKTLEEKGQKYYWLERVSE
ncbi:4-amino-4-deoxy-L-arabinose transferase-like glycosyltransferase [Algoriphagus sp. 4150]|uniref:ArnT family glycosyltransferase n=1 Tax=Algoriphagus sp. 4150 TaxID=2817756 RepID=UPI002865A29B|nr:phospholipid carrier-dependent glycosyltransferase [Algoriphagus sp. 4150]MDR7129909.1 4-amino-4-deoxy-L-arabinose transferase-like glycosyltransferase [Algoriphagus sp. 4150]